MIAQQLWDLQSSGREATVVRGSSGLRTGLLLSLAFGLLLAAAADSPPARAATSPPPGVGIFSLDGVTTLSYRARVGQANVVTVTRSGNDLVVTDTGVPSIESAGGCTVAGQTATCPSTGVVRVRIAASDLNDSITKNAPIGADLFGGVGDDTLMSQDGAADVADCGGDTDSATVDIVDSAPNCEQVSAPAPDTTLGSGPEGFTQSTSASFEFSSDQPSAGFQCKLDSEDWAACSSPKSYADLPEGHRLFQVRAVNGFGIADSDPATAAWTIDRTAPQVVISGPNTTSSAASFSFGAVDDLSPAESIAFECRLDQGDFEACVSPITYSGLSPGSHTFAARATDAAGNSAEGSVGFTIAASAPPGTPPPPPPPVNVSNPRLVSLVLISGRTVNVSRKRLLRIRLNCSGTRGCKGVVAISTAARVRVSRNRIVRLGSKRFTIRAGKVKYVRMRLSRKVYRLVRKLRRVPSVVVVKDRDSSGRRRTSTRPVLIAVRR